MIKIGLTGGIGTGKTTVAKIFTKEFGVPVYCADLVAKRLLKEDKFLRAELINRFGAEIFDGDIIRKSFFHDVIFTNKIILATFNAILHPYIVQDLKVWELFQTEHYGLIESAILIETESHYLMDCIVVVTAPLELRIDRIKKRSGWTEEQIQNVISQQMPEDQRLSYAKFVINNDETSDLSTTVHLFHSLFMNL
jgi:dephospho-CoA kinase